MHNKTYGIASDETSTSSSILRQDTIVPAAVEAESFASISDIAANPPAQYIDYRHSLQHRQLTLYIVRVPGSRDVFLTPLKPRERVVTAQDVESSLYYVHVNDVKDVELLHTANAIPQQAATKSSQDKCERHLNLTARLPKEHPKISRKPVMNDITNLAQQRSLPLTLPALPPRPLPALPDETAWIEPSAQESEFIADVECASRLPFSPSEALHQEMLDGSLRLIRREPSTSNQWNVGTISDIRAEADIGLARTTSALAARRIKNDGAPLQIDIINPAYLRYGPRVDNQAPHNTPGDSIASRSAVFTRKVFLPGRSNVSQRWSTYETTEAELPRDNQMSEEYIYSFRDNYEPRRASTDMRARGYTFRSPWNGDCEFTTSASGRSLICRHAIAGHSVSEVSELRFNLPVIASGTSSAMPSEDRRRSYFSTDKRRSRFNLHRGPINGNGDWAHNQQELVDDHVDALVSDMSLGQEMAGGGFGGRQPKLGKVIIHPAGLAMLDLLIAANIGLWWRAWEKVR